MPRKPESTASKKQLQRIGLSVRVARTARGLTQRQLADAVGRSQNLIWLIESGAKEPGILLLTAIAESLDVPMALFTVHAGKSEKRDFNEGREIIAGIMGAMDERDSDHRRNRKRQAQ